MNGYTVLIKIFCSDIVSSLFATTRVVDINVGKVRLVKSFIEPVGAFFVGPHQLENTVATDRIIVIVVIVLINIRNNITIQINDIIPLLKSDRINEVR